MTSQWLIFHRFDQMGQPVVEGVQIRMIDLLGISQQNDLAVFPYPRDHGLHLMLGEILRFIDDDERIRQTPAPNIGERFDDQLSR